MGSIGTTIPKGQTMAQFMAAEFSSARYEFLATAVVRTGDSARYGGWPEVFYAAIRDSQSNEVTALVVPFVRGAKNWAGETAITYKPMDEDMGPCEASAPARILDLLTPTTHEYAIAWRASCRERLAKLEALKAIVDGTTIRTATSLSFGSFEAQVFTASNRRKNIYGAYQVEDDHRWYLGSVRLPESILASTTFEVV
jgi:hypothetical protein